jgi:hypothetical protein
VAEPLVGRTGATGACVLVGSSPRQEAPVAHVLPFMQQPPPKLAAQEKKPVEQEYADIEVVVGVGVDVTTADVVVGTMITTVEEGGGGDEEGWT